MLAFQLNREITLTRQGLRRLLSEDQEWAPWLAAQNVEHIRYLRSLLGEYGVPTIQRDHDLLERLPHELAVRIASALPIVLLVPDWLEVAANHKDAMDRADSVEKVFGAAANCLSQLQVIEQSLAAIANDERDPHWHAD